AVRLARLFDRYAIYRPEMLHRWEAGRESGWQAVLWRALVRENGTAHMADLLGRFSKEARNLAGPPEALPRRLSLFGVSAMPPSYLGVLSALASLVEVHLFMLSASQAEWDRIQAQNGGGHPLLANLGKLQRDFQTILHQTAGRFQGDVPLYETPAETGSALSVLQREILEDLHRGPARPEAQPSVLDPADDSISIHSCHGPTRELEVLHDRIVSFLEADRSLQPQDVVVMAPDIEAYAPLIDAVFGSSRDERPFLPYRISDRSARQVHGVAAAFLRLLDLLPGRMPAPAVLDLLDLDVVRERFSIRAEGLAQIREWVSGSQIRWGVDERHRAAAGQPACRENTWTFGLDRLLLGYAMPGEGRDLFCGVLPFDDLEGTQAPLLGSFVDFCETLFFFREQFTRPRTVGDWQLLLTRLLDRMIACTEQNAHQHQSLRETLARIARNSALGRFRRELPWDTLQPLLAGELSEQRSSRGFLSGGVTFCQLVPMRSIPFPVVCLLGMNDGEFPRTPEAPSFDLMARHPAVGDRTPLEDDRSLFLEAILAARRKLVITYTGQSVKNNRPLPPSVLVSSLLDALQESFLLRDDPAGEGVAAHLVVKHPLQPFSPRYFDYEDDSRLFSYATGSCEGAQSLVGPPHPRRPFLSSSLAEEPDRSVSIRLDELVRFFRNPARRFLERSLGLFLAEEDETLRDREPLELNGLEKWDVVTGLLRRALEGEDLEQAFASVKASGTIPPGTVGRCLFHDLQKDVRDMVRLADRWRQEERLDDLPVQVSLAGTWITGEIRDLWPGALLEARMSRLGRAWELDLWIRHLVLCLCAPESHPRITVALGRNDEGHGVRAMMFRRVGQPESILRELLDLYQAGQQ
ncbi:MAG: exodeoxyribonuclease V subunit gamma, partial [Acidobacteriota bacterium]